ncbi:unnamed protein product [Scytosiphon promiscuus]
MPGLVFRRRRLLLGGDELMVPYATSACGRAVWMVILAVGLALATHMLLSGACREVGYLVLAYEGASIVVGVLSLLVECQIANASTYGTIMDPGPRNKMLQRHFARKTWLGVAQLVLAICGTVLAFYVPLAFGCKGNSVAIVTGGLVLTVISQYLDSGGMYCCWMAFTSADSIWIYDDEDHEHGVVRERHGLLAEMENQYENFCRTACRFLAFCACSCNVFGGGDQEADFAHVSRVFSRMLSARRYVDVVATDIAAGLILVRHVQKAEDYKRRNELQGGPGIATYSTITTDPGLDAEPTDTSEKSGNSAASASGTPTRPSSSSPPSKSTLEGKAPPPPSKFGSLRSGTRAGRDHGRQDYGTAMTPFVTRTRRHNKFVSPGETMLDLTEGGEDWRALQEVAHFTSYANVMYSVWGTLVVDPWTGIRRVIRRSGSWCPSFISKRGAKHRDSLFRAGSSNSRGRPSGASVSADHSSNRGARSTGIFSSNLPSLCEAEIRGDSCWGRMASLTALRSELPHGSELVLAHFNNCLDETPYCVAVDHTWQTIVITIRGSHSFEDFLVDAMAEPRSLESVGKEWGFDGSSMHAHEGILRRAEWIRRDLEESGVLHLLLGTTRSTPSAFRPTQGEEKSGWDILDPADRASTGPGENGSGGGSSLKWKNKRAIERTQSGVRFASLAPLASAIGGSGFCSGYTLRAVGHSLGGGVAALLTLLLKSAYPTVRALAVSPPGGLVSEGACREATEAMVTSVVLNDDVVPRMSAQAIELLADQVLEVLGRSRVSKLFVMRSLLQREEEAHRPELYLRLPGGEEEQQDAEEGRGAEAGRGRRRGKKRAAVRGRGDTRSINSETGDASGSDLSDAEQAARSTAPLYHRQLRQYREYLRQDRASRRHLNRLRLPGRILHLVNTDYVSETVSTHACEDGYISFVCSACCMAPSKSNEDEVDPCCCTPGVGERRKRVFTPVWSSPDDISEIKVTPAFLVDHSPDEIVKVVEETVRDLGVTT